MAENEKPTKKVPARYRHLKMDVADHLIDTVLKRYKSAKSPIALATGIVAALGYPTFDAFDRAANRAERFLRNNPDRRMPSHIRDKFIANQVVQRSVAKRFGGAVAQGA